MNDNRPQSLLLRQRLKRRPSNTYGNSTFTNRRLLDSVAVPLQFHDKSTSVEISLTISPRLNKLGIGERERNSPLMINFEATDSNDLHKWEGT